MRGLEFIRDHMTYNLAYTLLLQTITTHMALEIFLDTYLTSSTFSRVTKLTQSFLLTIDWHHFESHDDSISLWNRFQVSLLTFSYPRGAIDLLNDTALQYQPKHNNAFSRQVVHYLLRIQVCTVFPWKLFFFILIGNCRKFK